MPAGLLVAGIPDHPLLSTAGTTHLTWMLFSNHPSLPKWKMRAVIMGILLSLSQHFSLDLILFKCAYFWASDCQGNISGNLFCLFTSHFLLQYPSALVGCVVVTSTYASCSKRSCFPNPFSFLITHAHSNNSK